MGDSSLSTILVLGTELGLSGLVASTFNSISHLAGHIHFLWTYAQSVHGHIGHSQQDEQLGTWKEHDWKIGETDIWGRGI